MRVAQVIFRAGQAIVQAEVINLSRITNTFTAIVCMDLSFLYVMKTVLNYVQAFKLQYNVL